MDIFCLWYLSISECTFGPNYLSISECTFGPNYLSISECTFDPNYWKACFVMHANLCEAKKVFTFYIFSLGATWLSALLVTLYLQTADLTIQVGQHTHIK